MIILRIGGSGKSLGLRFFHSPYYRLNLDTSKHGISQNNW